jgi:hypothetical protein
VLRYLEHENIQFMVKPHHRGFEVSTGTSAGGRRCRLGVVVKRKMESGLCELGAEM